MYTVLEYSSTQHTILSALDGAGAVHSMLSYE